MGAQWTSIASRRMNGKLAVEDLTQNRPASLIAISAMEAVSMASMLSEWA